MALVPTTTTGTRQAPPQVPAVPQRGISYTPSAPCQSACYPPDAAHNGQPWCDTKSHRPPGWFFWRTQAWAPCVSPDVLRQGFGISLEPHRPCATGCDRGVCYAGPHGDEEQDCVEPATMLRMLKAHVKAIEAEAIPTLRERLPHILQALRAAEDAAAAQDDTDARSMALPMALAAGGRQQQPQPQQPRHARRRRRRHHKGRHKTEGRRMRQLRHQVMLVMQLVRGALSDLRDVSDTLLVLEIEGSLRRPTGQGYATIGRLLQASIDTTLATCAAASAFLADPTLARYEAVSMARLHSGAQRRATMRTTIEKEWVMEDEDIDRVFRRMPATLSSFLFSTRTYWACLAMGVAFIGYRLATGDTSFTFGQDLVRAHVAAPFPATGILTRASWFPPAWQGGKTLRDILFLSCLLLFDDHSTVAYALRHTLLYRWLQRRLLLKRRAAPAFLNRTPLADDRVAEARTTAQKWWLTAQSVAGRVLLYGTLTALLDRVGRTACQFFLWLRRDVMTGDVPRPALWTAPLTESRRFVLWGARTPLDRGSGDVAIDSATLAAQAAETQAQLQDRVAHTALAQGIGNVLSTAERLAAGAAPISDVDVARGLGKELHDLQAQLGSTDAGVVLTSTGPSAAAPAAPVAPAAPAASPSQRMSPNLEVWSARGVHLAAPNDASGTANDFVTCTLHNMEAHVGQWHRTTSSLRRLDAAALADGAFAMFDDPMTTEAKAGVAAAGPLLEAAPMNWADEANKLVAHSVRDDGVTIDMADTVTQAVLGTAKGGLQSEANVWNLVQQSTSVAAREWAGVPSVQWNPAASIAANLQAAGKDLKDLSGGAWQEVVAAAKAKVATALATHDDTRATFLHSLAHLSTGDRVQVARDVLATAKDMGVAAGKEVLGSAAANAICVDYALSMEYTDAAKVLPHMASDSALALQATLQTVSATKALESVDAAKAWLWTLEEAAGKGAVGGSDVVAAEARATFTELWRSGTAKERTGLMHKFIRFMESGMVRAKPLLSFAEGASDAQKDAARHKLGSTLAALADSSAVGDMALSADEMIKAMQRLAQNPKGFAASLWSIRGLTAKPRLSILAKAMKLVGQ